MEHEYLNSDEGRGNTRGTQLGQINIMKEEEAKLNTQDVILSK